MDDFVGNPCLILMYRSTYVNVLDWDMKTFADHFNLFDQMNIVFFSYYWGNACSINNRDEFIFQYRVDILLNKI